MTYTVMSDEQRHRLIHDFHEELESKFGPSPYIAFSPSHMKNLIIATVRLPERIAIMKVHGDPEFWQDVPFDDLLPPQVMWKGDWVATPSQYHYGDEPPYLRPPDVMPFME